jgi:hypothetical protein
MSYGAPEHVKHLSRFLVLRDTSTQGKVRHKGNESTRFGGPLIDICQECVGAAHGY